MARRALQYCSQIIRYACVTDRAERDFTTDIKGVLKKRHQGHFAAIKVDELPKLDKEIYNSDARLFRQTRNALKLMLMTFVRTTELIAAPRSEFDLDKAIWIIPSSRMKMKKDHVVPLSKQAVNILREQFESRQNSEYVFPITNPRKHMSNGTILKALEILGYKGIMTGHGFRSLAMSTIKEKLRYRNEVVDRQLAHIPKSKIDKAYDRAEFLLERIKMMQRWADYINNCRM